MIKNILIPEKIGNYYIFTQRILGFDINKNSVNAVQIAVSGNKFVKIENYFEENLIDKLNLSASDRLTNSIRNITSKAKYDYIKVSLPAYLIIFKELTLPFIDVEKIRSVLNFEIEPILPFSIDEAVADFIITKQDTKKKETTILVGVARKKDILELTEPFRSININPTSVVVDIFNLFGLYKTIPTLTEESSHSAVLIDIQSTYTNIAYIQEGQLKLIRSIQQGMQNIVNDISSETNIDAIKINNYLLNTEHQDQKMEDALVKAISDFSSNIAFTLNSFKTILPSFSTVNNIILAGPAAEIKNINNILLNKLNIPCQALTINQIIQSLKIDTEKKLLSTFTQALSNAYPSALTEDFNLLRKDLEIIDDNLLKKQMIIAASFTLAIFLIFIGYSYLQTSKLQKEIANSKNQVITVLKNTFNIDDKAVLRNLSETINTANNKVTEEENVWFSFSSQARFSFLKYLKELSNILNDPQIRLNLKSLSIAQGIITIDGEVQDFDGLQLLEKKLNESNLFSHITVPQETKFTIKLTIKKNEDLN